jgi:hypothetical protein
MKNKIFFWLLVVIALAGVSTAIYLYVEKQKLEKNVVAAAAAVASTDATS